MALLVALVSTLLPVLLKNFGVNESLDNLIGAAGAAIAELVTALKSGQAVDGTLAALETALAALKADTSLDPQVLSDIDEAARDLEAAIAAYRQAQQRTDPTTLTPIPEV